MAAPGKSFSSPQNPRKHPVFGAFNPRRNTRRDGELSLCPDELRVIRIRADKDVEIKVDEAAAGRSTTTGISRVSSLALRASSYRG